MLVPLKSIDDVDQRNKLCDLADGGKSDIPAGEKPQRLPKALGRRAESSPEDALLFRTQRMPPVSKHHPAKSPRLGEKLNRMSPAPEWERRSPILSNINEHKEIRNLKRTDVSMTSIGSYDYAKKGEEKASALAERASAIERQQEEAMNARMNSLLDRFQAKTEHQTALGMRAAQFDEHTTRGGPDAGSALPLMRSSQVKAARPLAPLGTYAADLRTSRDGWRDLAQPRSSQRRAASPGPSISSRGTMRSSRPTSRSAPDLKYTKLPPLPGGQELTPIDAMRAARQHGSEGLGLSDGGYQDDPSAARLLQQTISRSSAAGLAALSGGGETKKGRSRIDRTSLDRGHLPAIC